LCLKWYIVFLPSVRNHHIQNVITSIKPRAKICEASLPCFKSAPIERKSGKYYTTRLEPSVKEFVVRTWQVLFCKIDLREALWGQLNSSILHHIGEEYTSPVEKHHRCRGCSLDVSNRVARNSPGQSPIVGLESLEGVANERQAHFWDFLAWCTTISSGGGFKMRCVVSLIDFVGREICRINI
jgi:hypothetical protein